MIVQCDSCNSRYRIAEEKILPQGIKVRCAKCKNVFVVKPPTEAPPIDKPTPSGSEQKPDSAPAPPELPPEPPAKKPSAPPPLPPPGAKGPEPPAGTTEPPVKATGPEEPLSPLIGTHSNEDDFQPAIPDFSSDMEDKEPETPVPRQKSPDKPDSPALPDLGAGADSEDALPALSQDIGSGKPAAGEGTPDTESMNWGNIALETAGGQTTDQADIDLSPPEPAAEGDPEEPPYQEEEVASYAKPSTGTMPKPDIRARPPGMKRKGLRLLLLLVLLLAVGYYNYPRIRNLLPSKSTVQQGDLAIENVQVSTLNRADGVLLATVRGNVRNKYSSNKGMIQVEAIFKDSKGRELARAAAYCGNLFSDSELASLDLSSIRNALNNELGQSLSNSSIAPGNSVPFLIIMENPPLKSKEVTVKVLKFSDTP